MNLEPRRRRLAFVLGTLVLATGVASGADLLVPAGQRNTDQGQAVPVERRVADTYGISSTSILTIPAWSFTALDDSVQARTGYNRYSPTSQEVEAPFFLPAGALISAIEFVGCDTDAMNDNVFIAAYNDPDGTSHVFSSLGSTTGSGCGSYNLPLTPHQVDNHNTYIVSIRSGPNLTTSYTAMRIYYNLQVSPAPGTATFPNDVPLDHPFFRYIEALAAAGITAGTGPGQFSPDQPVTRGQMAVFLSVALGLHFTP